MFSIKGRKYKIEHEGLHLLCLTYGKFRHYKEGCQPVPVKKIVVEDKGVLKNVIMEQGETSRNKECVTTADGEEGPWQVVQK